MKRWRPSILGPATMLVRSMGYKRALSVLLTVFCLAALLTQPVLASSQSSPTPSAQSISSAQDGENQAAEAAQGPTKPLLSKLTGVFGLVLLLALGVISNHRHNQQDDMDYDVFPDKNPIGDPYSRLSGEDRKKRRRFF